MLPDVGSYNPKALEYKVFSDQKIGRSKNMFGKKERFEKERSSGLGPGQYNIIRDWKDLKNKNLVSHANKEKRIYN